MILRSQRIGAQCKAALCRSLLGAALPQLAQNSRAHRTGNPAGGGVARPAIVADHHLTDAARGDLSAGRSHAIAVAERSAAGWQLVAFQNMVPVPHWTGAPARGARCQARACVRMSIARDTTVPVPAARRLTGRPRGASPSVR